MSLRPGPGIKVLNVTSANFLVGEVDLRVSGVRAGEGRGGRSRGGGHGGGGAKGVGPKPRKRGGRRVGERKIPRFFLLSLSLFSWTTQKRLGLPGVFWRMNFTAGGDNKKRHFGWVRRRERGSWGREVQWCWGGGSEGSGGVWENKFFLFFSGLVEAKNFGLSDKLALVALA